MPNPVVPTLLEVSNCRRAMFNAIEGTLARQWRTDSITSTQFPQREREHWVMTELVMVIEVFIALHQAIDSLRHQRQSANAPPGQAADSLENKLRIGW